MRAGLVAVPAAVPVAVPVAVPTVEAAGADGVAAAAAAEAEAAEAAAIANVTAAMDVADLDGVLSDLLGECRAAPGVRVCCPRALPRTTAPRAPCCADDSGSSDSDWLEDLHLPGTCCCAVLCRAVPCCCWAPHAARPLPADLMDEDELCRLGL